MKFPVIIAFLLSASAAMAQTTDIEVSYTAWGPNMENGQVDVKNSYMLLGGRKKITSNFDKPVFAPEAVVDLIETDYR